MVTMFFLRESRINLNTSVFRVNITHHESKAEGKTSQQALICISRRLISVIYGMLKNGTEYRMPVVENAGENR